MTTLVKRKQQELVLSPEQKATFQEVAMGFSDLRRVQNDLRQSFHSLKSVQPTIFKDLRKIVSAISELSKYPQAYAWGISAEFNL